MAGRILLTSLTLLTILNFNISAQYDPCEFNFGTDWDWLSSNQSSSVASDINYVTKWIVNASYNDNPVYGRFLDFCVQKKKTPVFYAYIIAKAAALGDADVGGKLGTLGAAWIKSNFNNVKNYYSGFSQSVASKVGDGTTIWLMEPDYYQYASGGQTSPLSFQEAGDYMGQLIDIIKKNLPNALVAIDISAWIEDQGKTSSWYGAMPLSKVDFLFTSGGQSQAGSDKIKGENRMTWDGVYNATKKPIIADCGYGAGGGSTGHNAAWDDISNLKSRIGNGVIAVTQKNPNGSWAISSIRNQLNNVSLKSCVAATEYTLSINAATGGTVTKNPSKDKYTKGTEVTLTASPSSGYKFKNWGNTSLTSNTLKITIQNDTTITCNFEKVPDNVFTLQINTTGGSGTVNVSPVQEMYEKGTQITLTAKPATGISIFEGWSGGGLSGKDLSVKLNITSNTVITATFKDTAKIDSIKIEAENFKQKTGDNLVTETKGDVTSIGYIENGYSTSYQISVEHAGTYSLSFRVGSGLENSTFKVLIDGKNVGTISFSGTVDNWSLFQNEKLTSNIELEKGNHTIQLNYESAINVDYFVIKLHEPSIPVLTRRSSEIRGLRVESVKGGFLTTLPSVHDYKSYSLYDCNGKMIERGQIKTNISQLSFSNLSRNVWILRLDGVKNSSTIRAAVVR